MPTMTNPHSHRTSHPHSLLGAPAGRPQPPADGNHLTDYTPYIEYISGPKKGTIEIISEPDASTYRSLARFYLGWLEPGWWEATWHPGYYRKILPCYGIRGNMYGYYDEDGWHSIEEGYADPASETSYWVHNSAGDM